MTTHVRVFVGIMQVSTFFPLDHVSTLRLFCYEEHPYRGCKAENDSSLLSSARQENESPILRERHRFNLAVDCVGSQFRIRNGSSGRLSIEILLNGKGKLATGVTAIM